MMTARYAGNQVDDYGLPRLSIDLKFKADDALGLVKAHRLLGDWLIDNSLGHLDTPKTMTSLPTGY